MQNKESKGKNNAVNLMIAVLSCSVAPIMSHLLDLTINNNEWDTERILVLYFASITGFILQDKAYRLVKDSGLYKKGLKLGNSDAVGFIIWSFPVAIVIAMYDDRVGIISLAIMTIVALVIISKDFDKIQISSKTMIFSGIALLIFIIFSIKLLPYLTEENPMMYYAKWLAVQLILCFMFDIVVILIEKCKIHRDSYQKK